MITEIIIGGITVSLIGMMFKFQNNRINKVEDQENVRESQCEERRDVLEDSLKRGEEKFALIMKTLTKSNETLIRLDERIMKILNP